MRKAAYIPNKLNFIRNLKIRDKLIFTYSMLVILLVFVLSTFYYTYSKNMLVKKSNEYMSGVLEQTSENVDTFLKQVDRSSYSIMSNPDILNILKYGKSSVIKQDPVERVNVNTVLSDIVFSRNDIHSIYLLDYKGNKYGTYPYTYLDFDSLRKIAEKADGRFVWMNTYQNNVIPAVRLVRNITMDKVGILVVFIKRSFIQNMLEKHKVNIHGKTYIVNTNGLILSSNDEGTIGIKFNAFNRQLLEYSGNRFVNRIYKINGSKCLITIYHSSFSNWRYVNIIPMSEVMSDVKYILNISIVSSILFIIVFIILSVIVAYQIANPINDIADQMKNVKIKNWSPSVDYEGVDEIGYLSRTFNNMVLRINRLVEEVYEQKIIQKEQELTNLQAQINPHFLYNTLDIINWMARTRNVPEIGDVIESLSNIMRYSINSDKDEVTIWDEINHVRNYCIIQGLRYGEKLKVIYEIDENIYDASILKLTLQPLVENCIVHGFKGKKDTGVIKINGGIDDDMVFINVIDNGKGMEERDVKTLLRNKNSDKYTEYPGIAVFNVNRRLVLKYGNEYGLSISSKPGEGTCVKVVLPLE